ncbi:MAG: flippase-like domain-containing protein [Candidatus Aegiribacteria sp.]|nr:flippase-like domain-containing protein [Candidatus Aegiribacteria sp.]
MKWLLRAGAILLIAAAAWIISVNAEKWFEQIGRFNWQLDWFLICTSVILLGLSYYIIPAGWILLSHAAGSEIEPKELRAAWFMSQLGRYIPGKVWLFAGRAAFLKSRGLAGFRATSVPFLELLYTAAGAGLTAIIPVIISSKAVFSHSGLKYAVLAAGISLLVIPFLTPIQKRLYRLKYGRIPGKLPLPGLIDSSKLLIFYSGLWWFRGLALFLLLKGFGVTDISLLLCCAAAPLAWLAGYIVFLVPGGIGVREAAAVALVAPSDAAGPVLAVIVGQRLILSTLEVVLALVSTRKLKLFGEGKPL